MFTGIVEEIGTVESIDVVVDGEVADGGAAQDRDAVLTVRGPLVTTDAGVGHSIAVDGVCLTITGFPAPGVFRADVMPETLRHTALGELRPGAPVNLERAVPVTGRLNGHIVQGHVDGVGHLASRTPGERWDDLEFSAETDLLRYIAHKGSITVSGVSLTVTDVGAASFGVSLIPATLAGTTLGRIAVGDPVNLEVDVLAKYVERLLETGKRP